MTRWRSWLELARVSNLPTAWTNVTAAWLVAGGTWVDGRLAWLWVAAALFYAGGMVLNDAADAEFDRKYRAERPIPSGRVSRVAAWTVGLGMLAAGWLLAVIGGGASAWVCAGLVAVILAYDLYHKPWSGAVLVMGACRVMLYLTAASALVGEGMLLWTGEVAIRGWVLGAYIVGLTAVARQESAPMPPGAFSVALARALLYAPALLAAARFMQDGEWRGVVLVPVFVAMVAYAGRLMRQGGAAIGAAVGVLLAGIAIVDALAVAAVTLPLALVFVAAMPVLRLWQRKISAT